MNNMNKKQALKLLKELVEIPSYIGKMNPTSEKLLAKYLENWVKTNLKSYKVIKIPYGKERVNLLCSLGKNERILFACHMDTVPALNDENLGVWIEGDKVYGLGTKDMKGGIVSLFLALKNLEEMGFKNNASIVFYGDEEYQQKGMKNLVRESNKIPKTDLIISPESRFNLGYGARGLCVIKLKITGKTAHSARADLGVDAIQLFYKIYNNLCEKLNSKTKLGKTTITITELKGGLLVKGRMSSQSNMVPDFASGPLSFRLAQINITARDIKKIIEEIVAKNDGKVASLTILNDHPAYINSKSLRPLVNAIKESKFSVEYADPALAGYNDVALLAHKLKIPLVNFGPYGENNHSADEWVSISSIINTAKVYVNLMKNYG